MKFVTDLSYRSLSGTTLIGTIILAGQASFHHPDPDEAVNETTVGIVTSAPFVRSRDIPQVSSSSFL